jgi:hypothetical protein
LVVTGITRLMTPRYTAVDRSLSNLMPSIFRFSWVPTSRSDSFSRQPGNVTSPGAAFEEST